MLGGTDFLVYSTLYFEFFHTNGCSSIFLIYKKKLYKDDLFLPNSINELENQWRRLFFILGHDTLYISPFLLRKMIEITT